MINQHETSSANYVGGRYTTSSVTDFCISNMVCLLFILYTAELFNIIAGHGLRAHCYADDTQMYTSTPATDIPSTVLHFVQCMDDVSEWVA